MPLRPADRLDSPRRRFDPFAGSGSTLIACEKTSRRARLIEIEPKYCDVIVRRWEQFTGKQATLESTGATCAVTTGDRAGSSLTESEPTEPVEQV